MKFQSILSALSKLWNFEYVRVKAVTVACTITQREKKKKIKQWSSNLLVLIVGKFREKYVWARL